MLQADGYLVAFYIFTRPNSCTIYKLIIARNKNPRDYPIGFFLHFINACYIMYTTDREEGYL